MNATLDIETVPFTYETEGSFDEASVDRETEFNPAEFPAVVLRALGLGSESTAVKTAIVLGQRDENRLTNLLFFARHPERREAPLKSDEAGFSALSADWLAIRDQIVRPALRSAGSTGKPTPTGGTSTGEKRCAPVGCTEKGSDLDRMKALVPLIQKYRGTIPLDFLLGWIVVESGGCVGVVTTICERGYFQLHPDEATQIGADPQRLSNDRDYSVRMGIEMVKRRMAGARQLGFPEGTDVFWHATKLLHWLPAGVQVIVRLLKAKGAFPPQSWADLKQFIQDNRLDIIRGIAQNTRRKDLLQQILAVKPGADGWDPIAGINNVNHLFNAARLWSERLQKAGAIAQEFEEETGAGQYEDEFNLVQFPQSVLSLVERGLEDLAIRLAVSFGFRDEVQLANLIFFARHPERGGRLITKDEPNAAQLGREWLTIRDQQVRPALRASPSSGSTPARSPTPSTQGGATPDIVSVRGIRVARSIADPVERLLAAAERDGVKLSGGGFRSAAAQIDLRKKHCGTTHYDIYEKPSSQCVPPTAPPGRSLHERGLAIDFTYNGQSISTHENPGYQWLARNAANFGLKNLPSEPWHWSTTGG